VQEDARISFAELARKVGLSGPAVADRLKRLEALDVIVGYCAKVNPIHLGYFVEAWVRIKITVDRPIDIGNLTKIRHIRSLYKLAGEDDWLANVVAESNESLGQVLAAINRYGTTSTSIVLSRELEMRGIEPTK